MYLWLTKAVEAELLPAEAANCRGVSAGLSCPSRALPSTSAPASNSSWRSRTHSSHLMEITDTFFCHLIFDQLTIEQYLISDNIWNLIKGIISEDNSDLGHRQVSVQHSQGQCRPVTSPGVDRWMSDRAAGDLHKQTETEQCAPCDRCGTWDR